MAREDYLAKVMNLLDNEQFYEPLPDNPTEQFSEEIKTCLIDMVNRHVIDDKIFDFLWPWFYILPKLHTRNTGKTHCFFLQGPN